MSDVKVIGERISLTKAAEMTARHRSTNSAGSVLGHLIGAEHVRDLLAQTGCEGMRIYHAIDENGQKQLVLVGVDKDGNDMETGIILDRVAPCPAYCSKPNSLNS